MSRARQEPTIGQMQADRRKYLLWGSVALVALAIVVAIAVSSRVPQVASTPTASAAPLVVGEQAPDFSAATTQGPFTLSTDAKGQPVFLEVLATWCPHCQRETQVLNAVYAKYKDRVHFVAVTGSPYGMDGSSPASQGDLVDFAQKFGVTYPIAYDPDLSVQKKYLQNAFPTLVIIDKAGKIAYVDTGEITAAKLEEALKKVS